MPLNASHVAGDTGHVADHNTIAAFVNTHDDVDTATTAHHHTLGAGADQAAAGNHVHVDATVPSSTVTTGSSAGTSTADSRADHKHQIGAHTHHDANNGAQLAQADTHQSPDTDFSSTSLHHTLGTGSHQAAAGDHPGALLAATSITSGDKTSLTSTTMTPVDATNFVTASFTVPSSGRYLVRFTGLVNVSTNGQFMNWRPMVAGTAVGAAAQTAVVCAGSASAVQALVSASFLVTGRTPGASEVVEWGYAISAAATSAAIYASAASGCSTIEVWAA